MHYLLPLPSPSTNVIVGGNDTSHSATEEPPSRDTTLADSDSNTTEMETDSAPQFSFEDVSFYFFFLSFFDIDTDSHFKIALFQFTVGMFTVVEYVVKLIAKKEQTRVYVGQVMEICANKLKVRFLCPKIGKEICIQFFRY